MREEDDKAGCIREAIERRRILSFTYKAGARTAEPYILGHDKDGVLLLSAVQLSGGSGGGFRTFPVEGLSRLTMTERHFRCDHPDYNPHDRLFERVICQV